MRSHFARWCLAGLVLAAALAAGPANAAAGQPAAAPPPPQTPSGLSGTPGEAFLHASTAGNISGDSTYLDNPLLNGQPNAFVFAVPQNGPYAFGGAPSDESLSVWYSTARKQWAIFNGDLSGMLASQAWNIWIPPAYGQLEFVHTSNFTNTTGSITYFDNPQINGHPEANLFVQHVYNPPGQLANVFTNTVALLYDNAKNRWGLQNLDGTGFYTGTSFFVAESAEGQVAYRHLTTAANHLFVNATELDNALINGNPDALILIAQDGGLAGSLHTSNHRYELTYNSFNQRWFISSEDGSAMPLGLTFNVLIVPPRSGFLLHIADNSGHFSSPIDNPDLDGNPYARLYVIHNQNPPESPSLVINIHPVGVFYNSGEQRWNIYNRDFAAIAAGTAFNVFYSTARGNAFEISANPANTVTATSLNLNSPALNGHAGARPILSFNDSPDGLTGAPYTADVGLKIVSGFWRVFNTSGPNFPAGLSYNVWVPPAASSFVVTGTFGLAGNLFGSRLYLDNALTDGDPYARVFVTQRDNGGLLNEEFVGVNYNDDQWAINNEDGSAIPAGAVFDVFVYKGRQLELPLLIK